MKSWLRYGLGMAILVAMTACGQGADDMEQADTAGPDQILVGGMVLTGDGSGPPAEAMAISAGRILAVGGRDEIEALATADTLVTDLDGGVVVPGLVDAHGHILALGFDLRRVQLKDLSTLQALVSRVQEQAGRQAEGTWILGRGWDQSLWPGKEFPHHEKLSVAVPDHPVLVRRVDGHAALANAMALHLAGITAATPDPAGGRILRDEHGEPTGVFIDNAIDLVNKVVSPPGREEQMEALELAVNHLVQQGLTAVHDAGVGYSPSLGFDDPQDPGWAMVDLYRDLLAQDKLPLRIYAMLGGNGADPGVENFFARPPVLGEGDGMLTVRAVKLGVDGALGSRGAAMEEPYSDEPDSRGLLTREQASLDEHILRAYQDGWQVAVHAIGDRANRMVLDAVQKAQQAVPGAQDARPRIEHAQVLRPEDVQRFAELGVIASVQPTHATSDQRWAEQRVGVQRLQGAYAYASLSAAGALVVCGSDFPIERANPLEGLQAAVARTDRRGNPEGGWRKAEGLSPKQALACFTAGPAHASFMETETGRIQVGMRADLTVLAANPLTVDPTELGSLQVLRTLVGGRTVFAQQVP
jgi:predicted amidohydrolase YtcJ